MFSTGVRRAALLAAALIVPACGGGGGGGGGGATAPAAPTGLAAVPGDAQVALSWSASAGATSYNVYRSAASGGPYTNVAGVSATTHTDTGLANGTTYYYVVRAVNGVGESDPSGEVSGAPNTVPVAPGAPTAVPGDSQVALSWGAVGGTTGYRVERSGAAGGPYTVVTTVATTSYTDTGLTNGTTYYYTLRGVNGSVVGPASPETAAVPFAPTAFNAARGVDYTVWAVAPAADGTGDVYAGGALRSFGTQGISGVVRLNSNGTYDSTFSTGTGFGVGVVRALAPIASGDVYVGGEFTTYKGTSANRILRLDSDGTVDAVFAIGTGFNADVYALAPDGSGGVYVGGAFTTYKGATANRIVRLDADGSVNPTFVTGTGFGFTAVGSNVQTIVPATDGSGDIYVGGQFSLYSGSAASNVVRLKSDGSLDTTFGATSGGNVYAIAPAADATGDIFIGGVFATFNGSPQSRIVRVNSNGTTDTSFMIGSSFNNDVLGLVAAGADVYVCGLFTSYGGTSANRTVRLNGDGSIDAAFAIGTGFNSEARAIAADGSGGIFVGGFFTAYNGVGIDRLARLNSTGTLVALPVGAGFSNVVNAFAFVSGSTDVYVGGVFTHYDGAAHNGLVRLNSDGTVDGTLTTGAGFVGGVTSLAVAADGDLYVGGGFTWYDGTSVQGILRLNPTGSVDTAFVTGPGFNGTVTSLAMAPDGSGDIYVGGLFSMYKATPVNRIVRLNSDGSIDTNFAIGAGFDSGVFALATDPSGAVYAGGQFTSYDTNPVTRVVKLNSNGSIDSGFATGAGFSDIVYAIAPDGSGDVYFAGAFGTYKGLTASRVARVNSDGSLDTGFVTGTGFNGIAQALATAPGGDVYVGGNFSTFNGGTVRPLVRLNSDGSLDSGFPGARPATTYSPGAVQALGMLPDATGRLYMGGNITTWAGTTMDFFARLTSAGAVE